MLSLERDACSMVKWPRRAASDYTPPPDWFPGGREISGRDRARPPSLFSITHWGHRQTQHTPRGATEPRPFRPAHTPVAAATAAAAAALGDIWYPFLNMVDLKKQKREGCIQSDYIIYLSPPSSYLPAPCSSCAWRLRLAGLAGRSRAPS